jgi:hypothetical protein
MSRRWGFSTSEFNAGHAVLIVCDQGVEIYFMKIDWGAAMRGQEEDGR